MQTRAVKSVKWDKTAEEFEILTERYCFISSTTTLLSKTQSPNLIKNFLNFPLLIMQKKKITAVHKKKFFKESQKKKDKKKIKKFPLK